MSAFICCLLAGLALISWLTLRWWAAAVLTGAFALLCWKAGLI